MVHVECVILQVLIDEGESCTDYSLLDVYANREQYDSSQNIINMNFVQFATTYKVVKVLMSQKNFFDI